MSKAAHTATPWRVTKREYGADLGFFIQTVDMNHQHTFIGEVGGGLQSNAEIVANAHFIERAVNHHQELVTRLYNLRNAANLFIDEITREIKAVNEGLPFERNTSAYTGIELSVTEANETLKKVIE